ncbi:MAG: YihY/virulence factor BrkB family protein [Chlorobi bacterium]|nr:YihY/virulence factor BrkB family protein [Chlorobiota bacterium]
MKKIKIILQDIAQFLTHDIWRVQLADLPRKKSFIYRQIRIIILAFRGFFEDKIQLRASALTYYTMLSIVPVLAMIFGVAKGFGIENKITEELMRNFQGQKEVLNWVISFAHRMLDTTKGGFVAGLGLLLLFWAVMKVLGNIEGAFNNIWQIQKSRSFFRKLSDYLSVLLIAPVLVFVSSSVTVFISSQVSNISEGNTVLGYIGPLIMSLLKLSPYVMIWLLFTFIYMTMPNTKVRFSGALVAGIVAGTMFQFIQWGYIYFQVGVSRYNAIYGSFAAIPLFMIWLQISWLVVLFGAELSFAYQNVTRYEFEADIENLSRNLFKQFALYIVSLITKRFIAGEKALTATKIAVELKLPVRLVRRVLFDLTDSGILSELTTDNPRERAWQPALDPHKITVAYVMEKLDDLGSHHILLPNTQEFKKIQETLGKIGSTAHSSPGNLNVTRL